MGGTRVNATVVVRNRASIPVPADSLGAWRVVCQALGHRLFWDEAGGILHVDSHLDGWAVILDPAHGGADRGSRGPAGHCEADFVLDVALRAAPRFSRLGATLVLTRDGDDAVSLADRIGPGRAAGPSLFISLHTSPAAGRHRVEAVYHLAGWPWAARLAAHLGRWLSRQTQLPWGMRCCLLPGSEEGYGGVLWRAGAGPSLVRGGPRRLAVLVYLGGQGDILGENRLADPTFREDCAEGLLLGVLDFLMEYPLERGGEMRLLEPVSYLPPSFATAPPGTASDSSPPRTASDSAPPGTASDSSPPGTASDSAPQGADSASSAGAAAPPTATSSEGAPPTRAAVSAAVPRVVGGSVVVPGTPPGYILPARASGSVQVPVSWPASRGDPPGAGAAGVRPPVPSGQVSVRQPFG